MRVALATAHIGLLRSTVRLAPEAMLLLPKPGAVRKYMTLRKGSSDSSDQGLGDPAVGTRDNARDGENPSANALVSPETLLDFCHLNPAVMS